MPSCWTLEVYTMNKQWTINGCPVYAMDAGHNGCTLANPVDLWELFSGSETSYLGRVLPKREIVVFVCFFFPAKLRFECEIEIFALFQPF